MILCFYPRHPRGWRPWKAPLWTATATGFYPRHPRGWRRSSYIFRTPRRSVSIHATLAGGDREPVYQQCGRQRVSIHATLAGGDALNTVGPVCQLVSIHATLAGGDVPASPAMLTPLVFLSTPPSRVATQALYALATAGSVFLSTPPSRVATQSPRRPHRPKHVSIHATLAGGDCCGERKRGYSRVSIHATLAGGDGPAAQRPAATPKFLSTPPSRVATSGGASPAASFSMFLSTPPSRVATFSVPPERKCQKVSIHATLAGGDRQHRAVLR